jgi:hypothetical protein
LEEMSLAAGENIDALLIVIADAVGVPLLYA